MIHQVIFYAASSKAATPVLWYGQGHDPIRKAQCDKWGRDVYNYQPMLAHFIKEAPAEDAFVFVVQTNVGVSAHVSNFDAFLKEYDLESYVKVRTPSVSNPVHKERGRNLSLVILQKPSNQS